MSAASRARTVPRERDAHPGAHIALPHHRNLATDSTPPPAQLGGNARATVPPLLDCTRARALRASSSSPPSPPDARTHYTTHKKAQKASPAAILCVRPGNWERTGIGALSTPRNLCLGIRPLSHTHTLTHCDSKLGTFSIGAHCTNSAVGAKHPRSFRIHPPPPLTHILEALFCVLKTLLRSGSDPHRPFVEMPPPGDG